MDDIRDLEKRNRKDAAILFWVGIGALVAAVLLWAVIANAQ